MWKINLKVLGVTAVVMLFYTAVANIIPQLQSEVPEALDLSSGVTAEALVAAGEKIYNGAGACTACHGLGTRAPNILTDNAGEGQIGARCAKREQGVDCKTYLYESMTNPGKYIVKGFEPIMPDMRRQLTEDQIWATIAFLQSQGGEVTVTGDDIKKTAPAAGAAPAAAAGPGPTATMDPVALISEKGCIGCHILDGKGGPIGPPLDGMGGRINADRIRRGILQPNADTAKGYEKAAGMMPAMFGTALSAAQLEALVQFLASKK
jgi:mono/diheme cytochrome c family protein